MVFVCLCTIGVWQGLSAQWTLRERFEGTGCNEFAWPFFEGCIPNWANASGTSDITGYFGVPYYEVTFYAHMYARWAGECFAAPDKQRSEGIYLNYNFVANQTYEIKFAMIWDVSASNDIGLGTEWILTNQRFNQWGDEECFDLAERTPPISPADQIVASFAPPFAGSDTWREYTITFTPNANYSQLWLRNQAWLIRGSASVQVKHHTGLDNFRLLACNSVNLNTNFLLTPSSNADGSVNVSTLAFPNQYQVGHWWDVFYAPNGNTSGNSEVPGNPVRWSTSAFFNQNLRINEWYYIKHGVWNNCAPWEERRKAFRVQVLRSSPGERPKYQLEYRDVDFEPTEEYTAEMTEWARQQIELSEASPESLGVSQPRLETKPDASAPRQLRNFPNPFHSESTIAFTLDRSSPVSLIVRDVMGSVVEVLVDGAELDAGEHQFRFAADELPRGVYYYTLYDGQQSVSQKMTVQ